MPILTVLSNEGKAAAERVTMPANRREDNVIERTSCREGIATREEDQKFSDQDIGPTGGKLPSCGSYC
jgi:hypothetical protein